MSQLISFFGWTFLPDFIAGHLQSFYYGITIRAGEPRPQPGSIRFAKDKRFIQGAVIVAYLLYTLYEAHWEIRRDGDFYSALGVGPGVEDKAIQSRFRKLTLLHHPDKISSEEARPAAEKYYIALKLAKETLLDPAKRFAYDRFGPGVTDWQNCVTINDYVSFGLKSTMPLYFGSAVGMLVFGWLGFLDWGTYWRWLAMAALAVFELRTLTRADFPVVMPLWMFHLIPQTSLLAKYRPQPYLPFQMLKFAHRAFLALLMALARLGPLLQAPLSSGVVQAGMPEEEKTLRQINRLEQSLQVAAMESGRQLALELVPFQDADTAQGEAGADTLKQELREWLVTNTIRNDRTVQTAVQRALERRRREAEGQVVGDHSIE